MSANKINRRGIRRMRTSTVTLLPSLLVALTTLDIAVYAQQQDGAFQIRSHYNEGPVGLQTHGLLRGAHAGNMDSMTNPDGDDEDNNDMTAIVHIGPHKTGTTSIQAYTAILHKELAADNYEMPWGLLAHDLRHVNAEPFIDLNQFNLVSCLQDVKELWPEAKCNPALIDATEQIAASKKNIILTAEEFSRTDLVHIDRLKSLLQPWKNTRIVAYYRRFDEWLFSYWHQFAKYKSVEYRQSFPRFLSDQAEIQHLHDHTYTAGCVSHFRVYFSEVVVFNMHDMGEYRDVSEMFFCETIPESDETTSSIHGLHKNVQSSAVEVSRNPERNAPGAMKKACAAVKDRDRKGNYIEFNHKEPLVYEELAYYAEIAGLWSVNETMSVKNVAKLVRHRHEQVLNKSQYDFQGYINCPNTELLEWLLTTTLDDEYEFFPTFFESPAGEEAIRARFEKDRITKYCSIDAEKIIDQDEEWIDFFTQTFSM